MTDKLSEKEIEDFNIEDNQEYPVMPLRNTVLFPQQVIPIYIGRERSLRLIKDLDPKERYTTRSSTASASAGCVPTRCVSSTTVVRKGRQKTKDRT